ncbi:MULTISPECIES: hypothetical protein [unclassified Lacinutrix]
MSKTINRIMLVIKHLGISARQFDISIGTANGYILRMQKNNASVGSDVIERIMQLYPQINLVWLITGEGNMLLEKPKTKISQTNLEIEQYINDRLSEKWSAEKKLLLDEILTELKSIENK